MSYVILASGVLGPVGLLATEIITSLFIFIFLLCINMKFTCIVSGTLSTTMLLFVSFNKSRVKLHAQKRSESWSAMTKDLMQGLGGIKESKIYGLETPFISMFAIHSKKAENSVIFSNVFQQASRFMLEAVIVTIMMAAIGFLTLSKSNSQDIILLLALFGVTGMQLLPSLNRIMTSITSIKYSLPALETLKGETGKYSEFLNKPRGTGREEAAMTGCQLSR